MALSIPIISEFDGKGIDKAIKEFKQLETVGEKAQFAIKKAAIPAAAALTAVAGALGLAAKAAAEDEQQQALLANAMQNTVGATEATIAATEDMISAMSRATGTADSELRPAFSALLLGTHDVQKATDALTIAQDVSAGSGKSLAEVSDALAKAYGGNMKGLQALSPELKSMIKEGATLDTVMSVLADNFGGSAAASAKTAAGQFKILKNSLAETQESIGAGLLPVLQKVLPVLQKMADWAQQNPKAFLFIASTISAIAVAILAVNFAMAANPFTLIAVGIGLLITGLAVAYTKFEGFRLGVNFVINGLIHGFENLANGFIDAINLIIRGINLVSPFSDLNPIGRISLGRVGGFTPSPAVSGGGAAREGGTGNITPSLPSMPTMPDVISGGGGGGGGGGGSSVGLKPLPSISNPGGGGGGVGGGGDTVTIQVDGGLATGAQIGQAVYNALLQYKQIYGPLTAFAE